LISTLTGAVEAERVPRRSQRPGEKSQGQGDEQAFHRHPGQAAGKAEHAEHDEQRDLAQPGGRVVELEDAVAVDQ
jgi:hypothetical protein